MCWVRRYTKDPVCKSGRSSREYRKEVERIYREELIKCGVDPDAPPSPMDIDVDIYPTNIVCASKNVIRTWNTNWCQGEPHPHSGGFDGWLSCRCPDCGWKWIEIPENYEEILEKYGKEFDWRKL